MTDAAPDDCLVGVLLFHGVEELEATAPHAVFSTLRRVQLESGDVNLPETLVLTVSRTPGVVHGANGFRFLPDYDFSMCPDLTVLVVPGGGEVDRPTVPEMEDPALWDFVHERAGSVRCLAAVGTGAFVLAKAGVLAGKRATTRDRFRAELSGFPHVHVEAGRVVEDGSIWTAATGVSAVTLSLRVIDRLYGRAAADRTATVMGVDWNGTPSPS